MRSAETLRFSFPNAEGHELAARLELPVGSPRAYAVFAHCFTCSKDVHAATRISRALTGAGIAVLRFDFTGLGSSEGEFANTDFSSNVDDLVAAAEHLRREHDAPRLLVGHSLGGAAVLAAADRIDEVRAVATIGAPSTPVHVRRLLGGDAERIEREGSAEVTLAGRRFRIRRDFLEDLDEQRLAERIGRLGRALLVYHAPDDDVVPIEEANRILDAAGQPKGFLALDGADHLLSRPEDAAWVASTLAAWAQRYLPEPTETDSGEEGEVHVEELENLTQRVRAGRHACLADEPASVGGDGRGPDPYGFLLAALGACTSMTLRMYARHKGLPLRHVEVRLRHERVHAKDCDDCESTTGTISRIRRTVWVEGDLDEAQRARMLEIADRCPVHRTLTGEIKIDTSRG
jgi:putative redox protein